MEEELRAVLLASVDVAALVGTRVNFGEHPQGEPMPAVVLTTIDDEDDYTLAGRSGTSEAYVQVDCYAGSYGGAKHLARAVRAALSGYSGSVLQGVFLQGARDMRAQILAREPFRVSLDFRVIYTNV